MNPWTDWGLVDDGWTSEEGGGERGEVGEEGLVAGWFISYKTPEAVTTLQEQENVCIALMQKNFLVVYGKTNNDNITTKKYR